MGWRRSTICTRTFERPADQQCLWDLARGAAEIYLFCLFIIGLIVKDDKTQLRRINRSLRKVTEPVMKWVGKLTWKTTREDGVRSATSESRPAVSGVGDMDVEERNSGDPTNCPSGNQKTQSLPLHGCV